MLDHEGREREVTSPQMGTFSFEIHSFLYKLVLICHADIFLYVAKCNLG